MGSGPGAGSGPLAAHSGPPPVRAAGLCSRRSLRPLFWRVCQRTGHDRAACDKATAMRTPKEGHKGKRLLSPLVIIEAAALFVIIMVLTVISVRG